MSDDTAERMRLTAMLNSLGAEYAGLLQINEQLIAQRDALVAEKSGVYGALVYSAKAATKLTDNRIKSIANKLRYVERHSPLCDMDWPVEFGRAIEQAVLEANAMGGSDE